MLNIVVQSAATKYTLVSYTITYSVLIVVVSSAIMLIVAMLTVIVVIVILLSVITLANLKILFWDSLNGKLGLHN